KLRLPARSHGKTCLYRRSLDLLLCDREICAYLLKRALGDWRDLEGLDPRKGEPGADQDHHHADEQQAPLLRQTGNRQPACNAEKEYDEPGKKQGQRGAQKDAAVDVLAELLAELGTRQAELRLDEVRDFGHDGGQYPR